MRNLLLAGVALVALGSQALAADLPSTKEAPVYAAPAFTWTGFYVGAQTGYAFGHSSINDYYRLAISTGMAGPQSLSPDGWLGGLHLGYNYQMGNLVLGVDGQFDWGAFSASGSAYYPRSFFQYTDIWTLHRSVRGNSLATVGARVGYAMNNVLLYAKGGLALTQWKYQDSSSDTLFGPYFSSYASATNNTAGWFVGAGAEYALNNNWSVNLEYRYVGFGRETSELVQTPRWERLFGSIPLGVASSLQTVELGVSYHFGVAEAAPVVAKY